MWTKKQKAEYQSKWYYANKEKCLKWNLQWRKKNYKRYLTKKKENALRKRAEALQLYGNKCVCCEEAENKFLSFDHISNGKGNPVKRFSNQLTFYRYLIKEKPKGIQILCHNCNLAKGFYGKCPHEETL